MAWQLSLPSARPLADFLVTLDARTGARIRSRDVLQRATGSAMIYNPSPVTEQGGYDGLRDRKDHDSDRLTSLRLPVTLERITSAKGCLVGTYVDARVGKKAKSVCAPNLDFTRLTRSNDRFEAVMAYFHIDRERAYVDSLGLTEPLRGKPQKVRADGITEDNSFYSSKTRSLTLGSGGVDDGEDADVISHEYGHSLQDQATPGFGETRQGATLGEGFGDYMAAAMSALTTGGSPFDTCIFDWDGVSYSRTGCGRLADRPQDLTTAQRKCDLEIHCVGADLVVDPVRPPGGARRRYRRSLGDRPRRAGGQLPAHAALGLQRQREGAARRRPDALWRRSRGDDRSSARRSRDLQALGLLTADELLADVWRTFSGPLRSDSTLGIGRDTARGGTPDIAFHEHPIGAV